MAESVRLVVLIAFCSQGDNVLDATGLVSYLDEWMRLKPRGGKVCCTLLLSQTRREGPWLLATYIVGCFLILYGE